MALLPPMALAACATESTTATLSPDQEAAVQRAAGVAALESMLASHDSATKALQAICNAKHKAAPPAIVADRFRGPPVAPLEEVRQLLALEAGQEIGYRHVAIKCAGETLSIAHNWYLPSRLTPEMNWALTQTDTPFGKVAAPLGFRREEQEAKADPAFECPPGTVSTHRALLRLPDGRPLAFVVECYTLASTRWTLG